MRLGGLNEMWAHSVVLLNCGRIIGLRRNPLIVKQGHSLASSCPLCGLWFSSHFASLLLPFPPNASLLCILCYAVDDCVHLKAVIRTTVICDTKLQRLSKKLVSKLLGQIFSWITSEIFKNPKWKSALTSHYHSDNLTCYLCFPYLKNWRKIHAYSCTVRCRLAGRHQRQEKKATHSLRWCNFLFQVLKIGFRHTAFFLLLSILFCLLCVTRETGNRLCSF